MMQKFTLSMLLCAGLMAGKADAQILLATGKFNTANAQQDSTKYYYSGTKATGVPKYKRVPEFLRMEDSAQKYSTVGTHVSSTVCTYNGTDFSGSITQTLTAGVWKNASRVRAIYKSGKPDTIYYDTWATQGSGSWRLSACIVYTWSANDIATATRLTRSVGRNPKWNNDWKTAYAYAGGNISDSTHQEWASNKWNNIRRKKYTWSAGKPTQVDEDGDDGAGNWKAFYRAAYKYDGSGRVIDIKNDANDNAGGWKPFLKDTIMYNSGNTTVAPDTIIRVDASTGNYVNNIKTGYEHDAQGRITKSIQFSWNGTNAWIQNSSTDSINKWYWMSGSDVSSITKKDNILNVYPSPASNELHVSLEGISSRQVAFVIADMQGKVTKSWTQQVNGVVTIPVNELAAGNYVLHINDGTQTAAKKFVISR